MKSTEQKVLRFINENELLSSGEKILIALSGGPDSVLLLHFLFKYKRKFGITLGAMHINHMIRGVDADKDDAFCKNLALQLKLQYHSVKKDVPGFAKRNLISIEEAAREVRYHELLSIQRKYDYTKIATAHTCSDNAETILLNLIKGAGIKGLSGIPFRRDKIIRPILPISKNEILEYLKRNKIKYRLDKSNLSSIYERNFIRNKLLPLIKNNLNPNIEQALFRSSLVLKQQAAVLNSAIKLFSMKAVLSKPDRIELKIDFLKKIDNNLWNELIKFNLEKHFDIKISFNDIAKMESLINKQTGKSVNIAKGLSAVRERNKILVVRKSEVIKNYFVSIKTGSSGSIENNKVSINKMNNVNIRHSNNKNIEYIDAGNIKGQFVLRFWNEGDKFFPLGMSGSKKVSHFLTDQKVPAYDKKRQLVLLNDNKIVWVVGLRIDERFKITDKTRKVIQLCLN